MPTLYDSQAIGAGHVHIAHICLTTYFNAKCPHLSVAYKFHIGNDKTPALAAWLCAP